MDGEILNTIKHISLESLCIAFIVFGLTMLIKWPIKRCTKKLTEEKRKAVNTVILFIPIVLSLILSILYYGILKKSWFNLISFETAISSWIISLTIYAIYERIVILIKGIWSGKIKVDSELTKETLKFIKDNVKILTSKIKIDEKQIKKIQEKITSLLEIKKVIESNVGNIDIAKLSETNIQIQELKNEERSLQLQINENQKQIQNYSEQLNNKGENYGV